MDKYHLKTVTLHSHTGCYIDMQLIRGILSHSQVCWVICTEEYLYTFVIYTDGAIINISVFNVGCYMCSMSLVGHLICDVHIYAYYVITYILMSLFISYNITTSSFSYWKMWLLFNCVVLI